MSIDEDRHVPRHSAHEDDATRIIPRVAYTDHDQTAILPPQPTDADKTAILPVFLPAGAPSGPAPAPVPPSGPFIPPVPAALAGGVLPGRAGATPSGPGVAPARPAPRRTGDAVRLVARSAGELLITFGLVVLLLAGYEVWGKGAMIHAHQTDLNNQLSTNWGNPGAPTGSGPPPPGWAIARLYIPRMNLRWVVVEGVDLADIRFAPGHYPGTAMPGQLGNFSIAGHREPGMFWDLDRVQTGDDLIVETRTNWFVYQVFRSHVVTPHSVEVVAPVPNDPGAAPTQKDMTLTTCNPKWDNYQRLVVHANMITSYPHSARPTQLGTMSTGS